MKIAGKILKLGASLAVILILGLASPVLGLCPGGIVWPCTGCYEAEAGGAGGLTLGCGGDCIYNSGGTNSQCNSGNSKSVNFTVPVWGVYKITANVKAQGGSTNNNSFFFKLNINDQNGYGQRSFSFPPNNGNWGQWDITSANGNGNCNSGNYQGSGGVYVRNWTLLPGNTYTATFIAREPQSYLDWFEVVCVQNLGTPTITPTPVISTPTPTPADGLSGNYYDAIDLTNNYKFTRLDAPINFNPAHAWTTNGSPNNSLITDGSYSVGWTGCVKAPYTGTVSFITCVKDGCRLYINGSLLVNQWAAQASPVTFTGNISLTSGNWYPVVLQYYINNGSPNLCLSWSWTGSATPALIPQANLSSKLCGSPTFTPTPFGTATRTPTPVPPVFEGLSQTVRLENLEYIPFPVQSNGGNNFYDISQPFTTAAAAAVPKNTARWKIVFDRVSLTNTVIPNNEVSVETRLGLMSVTCTTGGFYVPISFTSAGGSVAQMPAQAHPSNLSVTYFWFVTYTAGLTAADPVPVTERFDAMGDPRYTPYLDEMGWSANTDLVNGYNWFFKPTTDADFNASYAPFLPDADFAGYGPDTVQVDVPKLFRLVREGVMETSSIYTAMNGWNSYYVSVGGEIGGDTANVLPAAGPAMNQSPWNNNAAGNTQEILGNRSLIRSDDVAVTSNPRWRSRPWLGELWEDSVYSTQWYEYGPNTLTWGNLPNPPAGGHYYRAKWSACDDGSPATWVLGDGFSRNQGAGCGSLFNGSQSGSSSFNHDSSQDFFAGLLNDGVQAGSQLLMPMPDQFEVTRQWDLNQGNSQPEASYAPYNQAGVKTALAVYSAANSSSHAISTWGFYAGSSSTNTKRGSAAIQVYDSTNKRAGWFVVNGFNPTGQSGVNFVANFGLLACMRTFFDAGARTSFVGQNMLGGLEYRIEPIPYVEITSPTPDQTFNGQSSIPFAWQMTWQRWDQNPYTENYPNPITITAEVAFNLYYQSGGQWYNVMNDNAVTIGSFDNTTALTFPVQNGNNPAIKGSYTWNVGSLPAGPKIFRVEAWRTGVQQHYAYHQFSFTSNP